MPAGLKFHGNAVLIVVLSRFQLIDSCVEHSCGRGTGFGSHVIDVPVGKVAAKHHCTRREDTKFVIVSVIAKSVNQESKNPIVKIINNETRKSWSLDRQSEIEI